jgi:DNA-binding XRE family transcriptional regulator
MPPVAGVDLKVERVRANVTIVAVAAAMGVSRQTIWALERAAHVGHERARQYRSALVTLRDATDARPEVA